MDNTNDVSPPRMYNIVRALRDRLSAENISYCHWKSNINLDRAILGYDDLDLLLDRTDILRFEAIVLKLGFREAVHPVIAFPAVKHYYGYDDNSSEIVHLHVYTRLVTGDFLTKNLIFDFEDTILAHLNRHPSGLPVPAGYLEYIMFVVRMMTKFASPLEWPALWKKRDEIRREIEYLYDPAYESEIQTFLKRHMETLDADFLQRCANALRGKTLLSLFFLGRKLRGRIKKYSRFGCVSHFFRSFYHCAYRVLNRLYFHRKKNFCNGGLLIAVTGLDASGKTTITHDLYNWLGKNFNVNLIHLGKPPSALLTLPFNVLIRLTKWVVKGKAAVSAGGADLDNVSFLYSLRLVALAYDRMRLLRRYYHRSVAGQIVICDRYPSRITGVMDSPRLDPEKYHGLRRFLARCENRFYSLAPRPDMIVNLQVSVRTAVHRNRDRNTSEDESVLRCRHAEFRNIIYDTRRFRAIDTNRPYAETVGDVRKIIWDLL